jgi:hypothetical protein
MMQAIQLSNRWRVAILLAAGILTLFALIACGSDDRDALAAAPPTQAPAPTATPEPTAIPMPDPPAAAMVPATVPEPGSDEEQVMAVLEKQIRAVNAADYVAFLETCTPSAKRHPTVAQLKFVFEVNQGVSRPQSISIVFSPQGYNVREVEVKLLRTPFAQASFQIYDYDEPAGKEYWISEGSSSVVRTFEKVDGQWYSESLPCGHG